MAESGAWGWAGAQDCFMARSGMWGWASMLSHIHRPTPCGSPMLDQAHGPDRLRIRSMHSSGPQGWKVERHYHRAWREHALPVHCSQGADVQQSQNALWEGGGICRGSQGSQAQGQVLIYWQPWEPQQPGMPLYSLSHWVCTATACLFSFHREKLVSSPSCLPWIPAAHAEIILF